MTSGQPSLTRAPGLEDLVWMEQPGAATKIHREESVMGQHGQSDKGQR